MLDTTSLSIMEDDSRILLSIPKIYIPKRFGTQNVFATKNRDIEGTEYK